MVAEIARKIKRYFINDTKSFGFSYLEPYFLRWVTGALSYGDTSGPAKERPKRKPVIGVEHYISLAHKINGQTDMKTTLLILLKASTTDISTTLNERFPKP